MTMEELSDAREEARETARLAVRDIIQGTGIPYRTIGEEAGKPPSFVENRIRDRRKTLKARDLAEICETVLRLEAELIPVWEYAGRLRERRPPGKTREWMEKTHLPRSLAERIKGMLLDRIEEGVGNGDFVKPDLISIGVAPYQFSKQARFTLATLRKIHQFIDAPQAHIPSAIHAEPEVVKAPSPASPTEAYPLGGLMTGSFQQLPNFKTNPFALGEETNGRGEISFRPLEGNDSVYTFRPFGYIGAGVRIMVTDVRRGKNGLYEVRIIGWRAGAVVADDWRQIGPKSVKLGNTGLRILALQQPSVSLNLSTPAQHWVTRLVLRVFPSLKRTPGREVTFTAAFELAFNFIFFSASTYFGAWLLGAEDPGFYVRAFMPLWGVVFYFMHGRERDRGVPGMALVLTLLYGGAAAAFLTGGWWIAGGIALVAVAGVHHVRFDIPRVTERRRREEARRLLLSAVFPRAEPINLERLFPSGVKEVSRQNVVDLLADAQADLLIDSGAVVNGQWVVNATEPEGELERDLLNALVNAMARRSAVTGITALFRDNVPRDDAAVLRRFPEAEGKLDPRWASQTAGLNSREVDGRGLKLSAENCRRTLDMPEINIYSLMPSDVADTNDIAKVLGLENLVRASREVWEALQRYALVSEHA